MSEHAKQKADEKIKLFDRINSLKHEQMQMSHDVGGATVSF